jgi:hypothetical protein
MGEPNGAGRGASIIPGLPGSVTGLAVVPGVEVALVAASILPPPLSPELTFKSKVSMAAYLSIVSMESSDSSGDTLAPFGLDVP